MDFFQPFFLFGLSNCLAFVMLFCIFGIFWHFLAIWLAYLFDLFVWLIFGLFLAYFWLILSFCSLIFKFICWLFFAFLSLFGYNFCSILIQFHFIWFEFHYFLIIRSDLISLLVGQVACTHDYLFSSSIFWLHVPCHLTFFSSCWSDLFLYGFLF